MMNILILQGPNLNLLGYKSHQSNAKLTLDKLNKETRIFSKKNDLNIKVYQTHKQFLAINILQRNRNWADGILLIPTSWARNNFTILETINLINIQTAAIYFDGDYSFGTEKKDSILKSDVITEFTGKPIDVCIEGLKYLID